MFEFYNLISSFFVVFFSLVRLQSFGVEVQHTTILTIGLMRFGYSKVVKSKNALNSSQK